MPYKTNVLLTDQGKARDQMAVSTVYLATVAVFYAASFFSQERLWGLNWYGFFSWYGPLILLGLALGAWVIALQSDTGWISRHLDGASAAWFAWSAGAVSLLFVVTYIMFRAQTHFLGDGYQLLAWLENGVHFKPWESGTFVVQRWLYALIGGAGKDDAITALRFASWGSGLLFLMCSAIVSYLIFRDNARRLLMLGGLASGGYALLFFGYFESYPLFVTALLIFSLTGLLITTGRLNRFWIIPPLALAGAFHIFAVGLLPAAVYIMVHNTSVGRWLGSRSALLKTALIVGLTLAAAAVLLYFYLTDYFIRFTIVPLVKDRFAVEGYTMFSGKHLFDYANLMFLLLPALPFVVLLASRLNWRETLADADTRFLLALTGPCLVMVFVFNPGLGMPRDWDLFCFAGVPLNILFFYLLLTQDNRMSSRTIAFLAVALNLIMLGPRVASQVIPEKGLAVFDAYANLDVARSFNGRFWVLKYFEERGNKEEYERRSRENSQALPQEGLIQSALLLMGERRLDEAKAQLERAIEIAPCYEYAWSNLGAVYSLRGEFDSALAALQIADAMMPFRSYVYDHKARVYFALGDQKKAEAYWWKALAVDPRCYTAILYLVELSDRQQNSVRRDSLWKVVEEMANPPAEAIDDVISSAILRKDWTEVSRWMERFLRLGLDTTLVLQLKERYPELQSVR